MQQKIRLFAIYVLHKLNYFLPGNYQLLYYVMIFLKSWIKGLPLLDAEYDFDLQADGRLKSLRQDGWLINYLEYFAGDHMSKGLPRKMYLKHTNLAIKIVIDRWQQIESETKSPVIFPDFD